MLTVQKILQHWTWAVPAFAWALLAASFGGIAPVALLSAALILTVLAAVHHAELIAHKVGEPFGTFVLAIAVTVIELGLIVTLMSAGKAGSETLARDTVFAAVMIILNGLVGICILVGALYHREQTFQQTGVSASLATLCALTVLTLVLPNFTLTTPGPVYSWSQLTFVAIVSFLLYATFVSVQTVRHRDYFLPPKSKAPDLDVHADPPTDRVALFSFGLLIACLGAVVLLAKGLGPDDRGSRRKRGRAAQRRRRHHRGARPVARKHRGRAGGGREPAADQPQPGSRLRTRDDRPDDSRGCRPFAADRIADRIGPRRQEHHPAVLDPARLDADIGHGPHDDPAGCRPPRHIRRVPVPDGRSLT
jgi:hypothetical protein